MTPEFIHATAQGGTIHQIKSRYMACYLGECKFCNDKEEASQFLADIIPATHTPAAHDPST